MTTLADDTSLESAPLFSLPKSNLPAAAGPSRLRIARNPSTRIRQAVRDNSVTLLQRVAHHDLRNTDRNRLTSLSWAAIDGSLEVFEWLLLDYGHDDQELSRDSDNNTLLHLLSSIPISPSPTSVPTVPSSSLFPSLPPLPPALRSHISRSMVGLYHTVFPFLLDWSNSGGKTALHVAAQNGNTDIVSLLLERGADPELTDLQGNTPLHYAAAYGHVGAAEVLLKEGEAGWYGRNSEGFAAGDYAYDRGIRDSLGKVYDQEVNKRRAEREEEELERRREEDARRGIHGTGVNGNRQVGLKDEIKGYDPTRRRGSRQFDPSSIIDPHQQQARDREATPSHAHWQKRVPLPARADSLQSVAPIDKQREGMQDFRFGQLESQEQYVQGSEWLSRDGSDATPLPIEASSDSTRYNTSPQLDNQPPRRTPSPLILNSPTAPTPMPQPRPAPPSAPITHPSRPTMHHRRSSSMAQALGPGVTLVPALPHISIEAQVRGSLPDLKYAPTEEIEEDGVEDVESPYSEATGVVSGAYMPTVERARGSRDLDAEYFGQRKSRGDMRTRSDELYDLDRGEASLAEREEKGLDIPSPDELGKTPSSGTVAGPPVR